jgi:hypothetical protein
MVIISYEISLLRSELENLGKSKKIPILNPDNQAIIYIQKRKPKVVILDISSAETLIHEIYESITSLGIETQFVITSFQKRLHPKFQNIDAIRILPYNRKKLEETLKKILK